MAVLPNHCLAQGPAHSRWSIFAELCFHLVNSLKFTCHVNCWNWEHCVRCFLSQEEQSSWLCVVLQLAYSRHSWAASEGHWRDLASSHMRAKARLAWTQRLQRQEKGWGCWEHLQAQWLQRATLAQKESHSCTQQFNFLILTQVLGWEIMGFLSFLKSLKYPFKPGSSGFSIWVTFLKCVNTLL